MAQALKKKRVRNPVKVRANINKAALDAFARNGYEGATMRSIAREAGITIQLLVYHVKSKENLWKMVVTDLIKRFDNIHSARYKRNHQTGNSISDAIRDLVADTARYVAEVPELHRLMTHEAVQLTPRLVWLIENFSAKTYREITELFVTAEKEGVVMHSDPWRWFYAITGLAAVPFSVPAEYEYLTGKRPDTEGEIERQIDFICRLILRE